MRPDRLVVGEVRGAEVVVLLQALNTGHEGGCGTLHANTAADVPARLEALACAAGLSREAVHSQLTAALDVVVHLVRDPGGGRRRVAEICRLRRGPTGWSTSPPRSRSPRTARSCRPRAPRPSSPGCEAAHDQHVGGPLLRGRRLDVPDSLPRRPSVWTASSRVRPAARFTSSVAGIEAYRERRSRPHRWRTSVIELCDGMAAELAAGRTPDEAFTAAATVLDPHISRSSSPSPARPRLTGAHPASRAASSAPRLPTTWKHWRPNPEPKVCVSWRRAGASAPNAAAPSRPSWTAWRPLSATRRRNARTCPSNWQAPARQPAYWPHCRSWASPWRRPWAHNRSRSSWAPSQAWPACLQEPP